MEKIKVEDIWDEHFLTEQELFERYGKQLEETRKDKLKEQIDRLLKNNLRECWKDYED